ncbi:MAG TPA: hypothetical protein VGK34_08410 [Armatimonadota bacterium]|jgi:hypothetical protein
MRQTRIIDVLSVLGFLSAAAIFAFAFAGPISRTGIRTEHRSDDAEIRQNLLQRTPKSEIKADFEVMTAWDKKYPAAYRAREICLRQALRDYPSSARLHLRAGVFLDGRQSDDALREAARLDPSNALPIYLLAGNAASRNSWEEASNLIHLANRATRLTNYPLLCRDFHPQSIEESGLFLSDAESVFGDNMRERLKRLSSSIKNHALALHSKGHTHEALRFLDVQELMGRKIAGGGRGGLLDLLVGQSIQRSSLKGQRIILEQIDG